MPEIRPVLSVGELPATVIDVQLLAGTSGFSYKEWRGSFYPEGLPEAKMLEAYAARLPSVEINNTFYRMPTAELLGGWAERVAAGFCFALKAPRRITHIRKLAGVASEVEHFFRSARVLGKKLGPILFQLPPFLRKDLALLTDFAAMLPRDVEAAFEFRHSSWFADDVYALLSERGLALCAAEVDPDEGSGAPFVRTAPFVYVRLRRAEYDARELERALDTVRALAVERAYVYFKHEVLGPKYALALLEGAARPA